jgi:hypothetical protein
LALKYSESDCLPLLSDNFRIIAYPNATVQVVFFMPFAVFPFSAGFVEQS